MSRILPFGPKSVDIAVVHEKHRIGGRTSNIGHCRCTTDLVVLEDSGVIPKPVVGF